MCSQLKITEDEKKLFRNAMKEVDRVHIEKKRLKRPIQRRINIPLQQPTTNIPIFSNQDKENWMNGNDLMHFSKNGVRHKLLHQLRRGKLNIEAQLDLHRMTSNEAIIAADNFITACVENNKHCIMMIHGKGYHGASEKPIIKNVLHQWLLENPYVLAFHSAKPHHGGTGAVYVLLKSKKITAS